MTQLHITLPQLLVSERQNQKTNILVDTTKISHRLSLWTHQLHPYTHRSSTSIFLLQKKNLKSIFQERWQCLCSCSGRLDTAAEEALVRSVKWPAKLRAEPRSPRYPPVLSEEPLLHAEKTCPQHDISIQAGENSLFSTGFTYHSLKSSSNLSQEVSVFTLAETFQWNTWGRALQVMCNTKSFCEQWNKSFIPCGFVLNGNSKSSFLCG